MLPLALSLLGCAKPTPIAERSSSGTGPEFLSCPTCGRSTSPPRESTCFTAATPVSRSALPGSARERTIRGISGPSSPDAFAFYDPDLLSLRMSQATLLSDSTGSSPTLPKWGWLHDGALYELPTWVPRISAPGCSSLLGTPSAADALGGHLSRGGSRKHELLLKGQVKALLPTPRSHEGSNRRTKPTPGMPRGEAGLDLPAAVSIETQRMLQSPTSRDHKGRNQRDDETCLPGAVKLLPTRTTDDASNTTRASGEFLSLAREAHRLRGEPTSPPSDDGNTPPEPQHPGQLTIGDA